MPDITTIRGDSRLVGTPVFDADLDRFRTDTELGNAQNIEYKISDSASDETTYLTKTDADAELFITTKSEIDSIEFDDLGDSDGIIRVKLSETDTQDLPSDTLWHEFQVTDSNGDVTTVMQGEFQVIESSTNPSV